MDVKKYLVPIGLTGVGKSTALNKLAGEKLFESGQSVSSISPPELNVKQLQNTGIYVVDTGGLADTSGRSEVMFKNITQHLFDNGGVIMIVTKGDAGFRQDQRLLDFLKALKMCLEVADYTSMGILLVTNIEAVNDDLSDEEIQSNATKKVDGILDSLKDVAQNFAGVYAYNSASKKTFGELERLKEAVKGIRGVEPKKILTWQQVLDLAAGEVKEAEEIKTILESRVGNLEANIQSAQSDILWHEKRIRDMGTMIAFTWWTVGTLVGGVAAVEDSRTKIARLKIDIGVYREKLNEAKDALKKLDVSGLKKKANEIRGLIKK